MSVGGAWDGGRRGAASGNEATVVASLEDWQPIQDPVSDNIYSTGPVAAKSNDGEAMCSSLAVRRQACNHYTMVPNTALVGFHCRLPQQSVALIRGRDLLRSHSVILYCIQYVFFFSWIEFC